MGMSFQINKFKLNNAPNDVIFLMTQETLDVKVIDGKTKRFDSQRKRFRITYKTKSQEQ